MDWISRHMLLPAPHGSQAALMVAVFSGMRAMISTG